MSRNKLDIKVDNDFCWKFNSVKKEKEALKQGMLDAIKRKPKLGDIYGHLPQKDLSVRPILSYNIPPNN